MNANQPLPSTAMERVADNITILLRSSYPIVYVTTWEEHRALTMLEMVSQNLDRKLVRWSVTEGMVDGKDAQKMNPRQALDKMLSAHDPSIFVLHDFHPYLSDRNEEIIRRLRDVVQFFRRRLMSLVIISPVLEIPVELEKDITVVDYPLPSYMELEVILDRMIDFAEDNDLTVELNLEEKDTLVKAMQGLTESQAENALSRCLVQDRRLDIGDLHTILREKEQIIRKSGILEFFSSPESFGEIGGLEILKQWFDRRSGAFSASAREFGLPAPRGIMMVGVPGCGKSLCAKALAAEWNKPLLRFDVGKIFGGLVGQSEENMRMAIKVAESVAPAILWIDEIEKGLSGMGDDGGGGVVARVFGTFLTWMQEKEAPVFVIATANDLTRLPPELIRMGRFDERFFVDLPSAEERFDIFKIHLEKRYRNANDYDLVELAEAARDFSGAEIEQVVISALYEAFANEESQELTQDLLLQSIDETSPLSRTMDEQIVALRAWARNRCRFASKHVPEDRSVSPFQFQEEGNQYVLVDLRSKPRD